MIDLIRQFNLQPTKYRVSMIGVAASMRSIKKADQRYLKYSQTGLIGKLILITLRKIFIPSTAYEDIRAYLIRAERKMPDQLKHWIADILEGVAPTLKQPPGKVASGLENNMFIPRLVEKVAIKFKLPRTRGTNDDEISACDAVHLALLRVPAAIEIGSRQYETIRRAYANAKKAGIFIGN